MSKFKVGDRVRCYEGRFQVDGEVLNPNSDNESSQVILLMETATGKERYFNEKSCRKLVKKPRREFILRSCSRYHQREFYIIRPEYPVEKPIEECAGCEFIKVREVK